MSNLSTNGITLHEIDSSDSPLVRDAYEELLRPTFPEAGELDRFEAIQSYLDVREGSEYHMIVATHGSQAVAATAFALFFRHNAVLMTSEYTCVLAPFRGAGIGSHLTRVRVQCANRRAMERGYAGLDFSVVVAGTQARIEDFWRRLGYRLLPFPYIQLPLSDAEPRYRPYALTFLGLSPRYKNRDYILRAELRRIIICCNRFRVTNMPISRDAEYRRMLRALCRISRFPLQ